MSGVYEGRGSIRFNAQSKTRDKSAAAKTLVEQGENASGVRGETGSGANSSDDEGGEHSRLDALTGHVADDYEQTAVAGMGKDLKEVAADFARRPIFAFDGEARRWRQLL